MNPHAEACDCPLRYDYEGATPDPSCSKCHGSGVVLSMHRVGWLRAIWYGFLATFG